MCSPPSIIRKRFVSLLFLIQYSTANDLGLQAVYQEDSLAPSSLTLDNTLLAISGPSQSTTPFTSGSTSSKSSTDPSEPYPNLQDGNDPEHFLLSNEYCNSAAEQPYPSHRRRRRQNEKNSCDNSSPGASHQLENNNGITNPQSPTQNSVPNTNNHGQIPNNIQPPPPDPSERLRLFLYSIPGWDGKPNSAACNNPDYPLLQVPVCAPPAPQSTMRTSPAQSVAPCKFSKSFPSFFLIPTRFCATCLMKM